MKKSLLFVVFSMWFGVYSKAQVYPIDTVDCSYFPPGNPLSGWIDDAKRIALREIYRTQSTYLDSIQIPYDKYLPILEDLQGIFRAGVPNITDSIFFRYAIHTQYAAPDMEVIMCLIDTNKIWAKQWKAGNALSGNDTVDALMNNYGLLLGYMYNYLGFYETSIVTTYALNTYPIANYFGTVNGIYQVNGGGGSYFIGGASDIAMNDSVSFRDYIFHYAAGDCQSGCIINHYWKFRVYPGCAVQYLGSWGTPLQHPTYISGISTTQFSIFPNPASNSVTITIEETMLSSTATITDITGRKVAAAQLQTLNYKLETANFANGVYFISIENERGRVTKKLMIQK